MRRSPLVILALACCLLGASAAPALGAAPGKLYDDCQDNGRIDGRYSQRDFRRALQDLPSDLDEYTDCRDVIRRGQLAAAGGRSGGDGGAGIGGPPAGGGGGSTGGRDPLGAASAGERKAFDAARRAGGGPVDLGGTLVRPGARGLRDVGGEGHALPTPFVVLLALAAAALLAAAAVATRTRVRARGAG